MSTWTEAWRRANWKPPSAALPRGFRNCHCCRPLPPEVQLQTGAPQLLLLPCRLLLPLPCAAGVQTGARGGVPGWRHLPGRRCREGWSSPPPPAAGTRGQFSQLLPATAAPATVVLPPPAGPAACTASRHADSSKGQHQARGAAVQSPSPACQQQPTCSAASTAASGSSQPGASVWCRS